MAIIQQTGGQSTAENDFKFFIKDVYFLKGRGVLVEGIIHSGLIRINDKVAVNGKNVLVRGIKGKNGLIEQAKASNETVALLLDEKDSADCFKAGDILTTERCADTSSNANTFICDVCGKELPIKYRHNGNTCAECAEAKQECKSQQSTNSFKTESGTGGSDTIWLPAIYEKFVNKANKDAIYGEKIPDLIKAYKSLFNAQTSSEEIQKAFKNLMEEVIRTIFIVPFHYDAANEFENDRVIHCTQKAANKYNIESIVLRCKDMTPEQMSKLAWSKDSTTNMLTVDVNWWDISRISGSDGFRFEESRSSHQMYPCIGKDNNGSFFLCFTGIDQCLKVYEQQKNIHFALFTLDDIVEYISLENMLGFIINPDTETHCFIGKDAFQIKKN